MLEKFEANNYDDANGNPAGGDVTGIGLTIVWQNGPLGAVGPDRKEPNGAFVETVIAAAKQRIEYYQTRFPCQENADAIYYLQRALEVLNARTNRRTQQGVEGTHLGN